ncbi:MAG: hypothetical protein JST76_04115 [Bacteroidetes bacterium]|nr:hypothetical protein [Bacteroidota bacterium]MBS1617677.1 hypothetical protein [Bacteroidota bacterium]
MRRYLFILLILAAAYTGQAQKIVLNSLWRDSNIVINGDPYDWQEPLSYYDSKAKIQYQVANDDTALYIILKTMDYKAQAKILRAGMDLILDTMGKKRGASVLLYPLPGETRLQWIADPAEPDRQELEHPDLKTLRTEYELADKRIKYMDLRGLPTAIEAVNTNSPIMVAIGWDRDNVLTYEARIPFRTFYHDKLTAADAKKVISITVKVHAFDVPQPIQNGSMTDPSVSNSGMRGQGYGDTRPSMPNMAMPKTNEMAESEEVQIRMKLAVK